MNTPYELNNQHRLTFTTLEKSILKHLKELSTKTQTLAKKFLPRTFNSYKNNIKKINIMNTPYELNSEYKDKLTS